MPRNMLFGYRDWMKGKDLVFSGGSWRLGLENLIDIKPQKVAETWDNWPRSTKLSVDFGLDRNVGFLHFANLRTTSSGMIRVRLATKVSTLIANGATTSGATLHFADSSGIVGNMTVENLTNPKTIPAGATVLTTGSTTIVIFSNVISPGVAVGDEIYFSTTVYDSGWVSSWPRDGLAFGYDNWGHFTLNGVYRSELYMALGMPRVFIPTAEITARYIQIDILDPTGVEPLQIGCLGVYELWTPPHNFAPDWRPIIIDDSDVRRLRGGATYVSQHQIRRGLEFGFDAIYEDEDFIKKSLELALVKAKSQPLVVIPFPDDIDNLEKLTIYGLFSKEAEFTNRYHGIYYYSYRIEQI